MTISPAFASSEGNFYAGIETGVVDIGVSELDSGTPLGAVVGYQKGIWGAELEASFADFDYSFNGRTGSSDYRAFGLYGVVRSEGDYYFKAKAGLVSEEIRTSFAKVSDTGFSTGLGIGARLGDIVLEAEYTIMDEDINLFSVGANFQF